MIGRQVKHKTFGAGSIIEYENGRITVDFSGAKRIFQFPESFERFLTTDDDVLRNRIASAAEEKAEIKRKAQEERRKAKEEAEEAALKVIQSRSRAPFPTSIDLPPQQKQASGSIESVAFKCNFCDGGSSGSCIGFRGKCSDWMIQYNIERAKHVWCSIGSACRQYYNGSISRAELDAYQKGFNEACYESSFFSNWAMGAGVHHTGPDAGKPMHMKRIRRGALAVMTTRKPTDREADRFVFAAFMVNEAISGDDQEESSVIADPVWRIELAPGQAERILFWNYYFNAKKPGRITFGSGLHRYLTDIEAAQMLRDIAAVKGDEFSTAFFRHFCEMNGLEASTLEAPSGALMKQIQNQP